MACKVLIPQDVAQPGKDYLRARGHEIKMGSGVTADDIAADVVDCDAILARTASFPAKVFEAGRKLLGLEPQPPGTYAWIGTRTLSFTAAGGLPVATAFRARVPAGIAALDGSRLPQEVVWEFTTPRPQLVASVPAAGDSLVRVGDPLVLAFNVGVLPEAVARAASLAGVARWTASRPDSNLLRELDGRFWEVPEANRVALVPEPPLQRDTAYELVLGATLRAAVRAGFVIGPSAAMSRRRLSCLCVSSSSSPA